MRRWFINAMLVDGTGEKPYLADVLIDDERIVEIGARAPQADGADDDPIPVNSLGSRQPAERLVGDDATDRVDLKGKVLCPGFIDAHSHNDWFCLRKDTAPFFDPFIAQGITSVIAGNCGFSATGFAADSSHLDDLGGELFHLSEDERHPRCKDWLQAIDRQVPINVATLLGHGTARLAASGLKQGELKPDQEHLMLDTLEAGLQQGAAGISLGLMYAPGIFAPREELEKVARLCAKYDKILTVHPRAESTVSMSYSLLGRSHLLRALDELDQLTRTTGCRFEYSHLIFVGRKSWRDIDEALQILEQLERDGFEVGFDMYPFEYGASVITVVLPEWYQKMSLKERRKPWTVLKLRVLVALTIRLLGFGFDDIRLAYAGEKHPDYQGRTIGEIARTEKRKNLDVYLQVCEDSDFKARVLMGSYQNDEIVDRLMRHPLSVYMTDAWYEEKGVQNAGIYSAFPRFLRLGREKGIPIETTIHKMTGKSAQRFRIPERGLIKPGYFADLLVLDPNRVSDGATDNSQPLGIEQVYVNGRNVFAEAEGGSRREGMQTGYGIWVD
ncbi:MAG TPA: amidohydrolase family protein [Clostridia bacterium]|nr:amidohydrolase family protein [Clostridia bacterium]